MAFKFWNKSVRNQQGLRKDRTDWYVEELRRDEDKGAGDGPIPTVSAAVHNQAGGEGVQTVHSPVLAGAGPDLPSYRSFMNQSHNYLECVSIYNPVYRSTTTIEPPKSRRKILDSDCFGGCFKFMSRRDPNITTI